MLLITNVEIINISLGSYYMYGTTRYVHALTYSVALVRKRTIPTERPLLVGEVRANFFG
jgi:hypothetical protein